jgi:hypothetical protein
MKGDTKLASRLRKMVGVQGKVEQYTLPKYNTKATAKEIILGKQEALKAAMTRSEEEGLVFWTLENEKVGSAVVWKEGGKWMEERSYLRKKKEVFDAKVYAIMRAIRKATEIDNNE